MTYSVSKKNQVTLEYLLMMIAILLALIWAFSGSGPIRTGMKNYFNRLGNKIGNIIDNG